MSHRRIGIGFVLAAVLALALPQGARAAAHDGNGQAPAVNGRAMVFPGLALPAMDPARGRRLFATKGCVVCHSVNGVGGPARAFDAGTAMRMPINPFEMAARMWRGAEAMIALQREELGERIELSSQELADITAFLHDPVEQKKFSPADIPHRIRDVMTKAHGPEGGAGGGHGHGGKEGRMGGGMGGGRR